MEKKELKLEEMEKIVGGKFDFSTLTPDNISALLYEAWEMKVVRHYSKEQVIEELSAEVKIIQRAELVDLINQYWDKLA